MPEPKTGNEPARASVTDVVPTPVVHPFRGVLLFATALLLFACLDTTVKYLTVQYPVPLVLAMRYIVNGLLLVAILAPVQRTALVRTHRTGLVVVRGLTLSVTSLFVALALQRLPVAEMTAVNFMAPILVVLLARPVLDERIGAIGWTAAVAGFAGVMLIARPGGGLDPLGVLLAMGSVAAFTAYQLLSRILAATETTSALLFHATLVGTICFGATLPWSWSGPAPSALALALFAVLGITGGLGHFLYTAAYRHAPASLLAPLTYLQLVWAALLGRLVFGHVPDGVTLAGMGIIGVAVVLVALKSRLG